MIQFLCSWINPKSSLSVHCVWRVSFSGHWRPCCDIHVEMITFSAGSLLHLHILTLVGIGWVFSSKTILGCNLV